MRKNCRRALEAYQLGRRHKRSESIWTDGSTVNSYRTVLLVTFGYQGALYYALNRTSYSITTTIHQNAIAADLRLRPGARIVEVYDLPKGSDDIDLIEAAEALLARRNATV